MYIDIYEFIIKHFSKYLKDPIFLIIENEFYHNFYSLQNRKFCKCQLLILIIKEIWLNPLVNILNNWYFDYLLSNFLFLLFESWKYYKGRIFHIDIYGFLTKYFSKYLIYPYVLKYNNYPYILIFVVCIVKLSRMSIVVITGIYENC